MRSEQEIRDRIESLERASVLPWVDETTRNIARSHALQLRWALGEDTTEEVSRLAGEIMSAGSRL